MHGKPQQLVHVSKWIIISSYGDYNNYIELHGIMKQLRMPSKLYIASQLAIAITIAIQANFLYKSQLYYFYQGVKFCQKSSDDSCAVSFLSLSGWAATDQKWLQMCHLKDLTRFYWHTHAIVIPIFFIINFKISAECTRFENSW